MRLSLLVDALLVLEQHLHRLDVLLVDGVQQSVLRLHLKTVEYGSDMSQKIEGRLRDPS